MIGATTRSIPTRRKTFIVSAVINYAWQNIEKLDQQLGFYTPDENRVIRIKICLQVELPVDMHSTNTCIFSIGPYCSFTNLGDGSAVLASEFTTNAGFYKAGASAISPLLAELTQNKLVPTQGKGRFYAEKILKECAIYLPGLTRATVINIMVVHVKLMRNYKEYTQNSLYDAKSSIHQRMELGVEIRDLCYISNSGNNITITKKCFNCCWYIG